MKLKQSGWAALLCAAGIVAHAGTGPGDAIGSCGAPAAQSDPAPIISTPDYLAGSDDNAAPDPQAEALEKAWIDYHASVLEALRHSPAPRDWALATIADFDFDENADAPAGTRNALLERAIDAAPDDTLVQWIAVRRLNSAAADGGYAPLQRLQLLEPDNAAVWLETLIAAQKRGDAVAVDKALSRMAAGSRFDGHAADLTRALLEAYQRTPLPPAMTTEVDPFRSAQAAPYAYAAAITAASAMPAFHGLLGACRVDPDTGANAQRSIDCAAAGRLMAAHGDTQIANRIGQSVLRVARAFDDNDVRQSREQDWLREQFTTALLASAGVPDQFSVDEMIAYQTDWIQTGSELEAMRRAVARTGGPMTPPDDWIDKASPFSEERLQQDHTALQGAARKQ